MKVSTYIRRKNDILREHLGLDFDLVPEPQIEEVPKRHLSNTTSESSCPYCHIFNSTYTDCEGCIMDTADNACVAEDSTWNMYTENTNITDCHWMPTSPAYKPMNELITEYNKGIES